MLLPEENPLQTLPLSGAYDFIADIYDSYYAYSSCLIPPNMCVEAYATTMSTDGKHNIMPYDESLSYGTSYHGQLVMSSPLSREHPSRSPSVSSDSGKVKPQYTAELDVLCRICGDRASGFHYGVHSCEGCKGFFRRTLKKQLTYRPCQVGSQCKIDQNSRNKCQYCRYQRCLNAGMSQDAVRFGRMPKAEREKLVADKEVLSQSDGKRIVELRSLSDLITAAFREIFSETIFFRHSVSQSSSSVNVDGHMVETDDQLIFDGISSEEFHDRQIFSIYQELILPVMEASVKFAKKLPSFTNIPMHDQILLMKRNGFMVVQVALHTLVDREFVNFLSQRGTIRLSRMSPMLCEEIKSLLERTIQCADRINSMQLHVGELALFCAILLTQESPNLMNPSMVEELQAELIEALMIALKHNHPKQRVLLPRLLVLISDLIQIVEEFKDHLKNGLYDNSEDFTYVKPLLKEIFDLS